MLRTQIYLPEELYTDLNNWAKKKGISLAEMIRKLVKKGLREEKEKPVKENDLIKLSELKLKGGPKDLSSKFDSYLYQ